jgi:hypothetical protein
LSAHPLDRAAASPAPNDHRRSWEGSPTPRAKPWLAGGIVVLLAAVALGLGVREFDDIQSFFMEDGPIETVQAGMLMVAAVIFGFAFFRSSGARALFCVVAAFAIVFAVTRELPRCDSVFSGDGVCLTSTWKRALVLAAGSLGLLAVLWRRREWTTEALRLSNLRWIWPSFVVVALLAGAETAEHRVHIEIEESLELAAYLYLCVFGLWILRHTSRAPGEGGVSPRRR